MEEYVTSFIRTMLDEVGRHIVVEGDTAYIRDPVFGIVRNRVHAEICKALLRTGDGSPVGPILSHVVQRQNRDGSWNEIHPDYDQPSALITSFVGDALLEANGRHPHDQQVRMARNFVLSQEKRPGFFLKSSRYTADHLNVDATCGAFLAHYGAAFDDEASLDAAARAARHVIEHQREGVYPYAVDRGNYPHLFDLPCIHYQGVTMYHLAAIDEVLGDDRIRGSLLEAARWLSAAQRSDGRFDWSGSGLPFASHLSGAYAFALASFGYVSRWDAGYRRHEELCLQQLKRNVRGLVLRWERASWTDIVPSVYTAARAASIGTYPLTHRAFRFGYGMYRQFARRRCADTAGTRTFDLVCGLLGIQASTVEPSNNYPDLFMTSEVLDCLSQSCVWRGRA